MATRRPPNRKALIRQAAADLFVERGYHNVSMSDVAEALGIGPSALYHHYRNKQDLLLHTVLDGLDQVDARIKAAGTLDEALRSLAEFIAGRPRGLLATWEREARHLDGAQRGVIDTREAEVVADLEPLLRVGRTDLDDADTGLVAAAVLGALGAQTRHRISLSRRKDEQLAYRLATVVATCPLPEHGGARAATGTPEGVGLPVPGLQRPRRDQILTEAIRLFDERGYQSVTVADIGKAAGIVASGVYRHFPGKTDLLVAAVNRGVERMYSSTEEALSQARDPRDALERLLRARITIALDQVHLLGILTNERDQLPEKERTALRRVQRDHRDVWVQTLDAVRPGRDTAELKMIVLAVQGMVYFVVRSGGTDRWPDLRERLVDLGMALLLDD
ncbi:TetR/AcrR family transcriptional regulator [Streptacidiphilus anmyonensis]|uniref:TetR/AcrR family transcriptional regulator n=1 Tax=Streptacidiphilus anmyonensis TaxID=405782 RepID=UPI00069407E7|nr:TetR/AcrR family transcriptional regulator [Streptacidiphilus anmyonensis]